MTWAADHRDQIVSLCAMVECLAWYGLAGPGKLHCRNWRDHSRRYGDPDRCRCLDTVANDTVSDLAAADLAAEPTQDGWSTKHEG